MTSKHIPIALTALAATALHTSAATSTPKYQNQIIQIQTNELGEEVRLSLDSLGKSGSAVAPLPILYGDAAFELWSVNTENAEQKLLDTTVVNGYYSPEVVITTPDPNDSTANPRTRVDIGYSTQVSGISPAYQSAAATQLALIYNKDAYTSGTFTHDATHTTDYATGSNVSSALSTMMASAASFSSGFVNDDWSAVGGTETFSVWNPATDTAPASMANAQSIQVWPVASATFDTGTELTEGKTYRQFDTIRINIDNLYAKDDWRVRVIDPAGNVIPIAGGTAIGNEPQSRQPEIKNLAAYLGDSGVYKLEVTQQAEGLDPVPVVHIGVNFTYDRRIVINGHIGSSE